MSSMSSLEALVGLESVQCRVGRLMERLQETLDNHDRRREDMERRERIKIEWQQCALVIDR